MDYQFITLPAKGNTKAKAKFTTPFGTLLYPWLDAPDTKFAQPGGAGSYKTQLLLDPEGESSDLPEKFSNPVLVKQFIAELEDYHAAMAAKSNQTVGRQPYKPQVGEGNQPTGLIDVSLKCNAGGRTKGGEEWSFKPTFLKADKSPWPDDTKFGTGSTGRFAGEIVFYGEGNRPLGMTLRLKTGQIIELVEWAGRDEDAFEEISGSFQSPDLDDGHPF